jgi:hypothetical protein
MTISAEASDSAVPLNLTVNFGTSGGVAGLTAVVALRDGATTDSYLDFSDNTFKTSGWVTRQTPAAEVDPVLSPGVYQYVLNLAAINAVVGTRYVVEWDVTGAYEANASEDILAVKSLYAVASEQGLNEAVTQIIAGCTSSTVCGTSTNPATFVPNVYTGHKGDNILLPVYRNEQVITPAELAGATNLAIVFKNKNVPASDITISVGVTVSGSFISYVTDDGDGVFETAGTWEYQATGELATGEDFRSQVGTTQVIDTLTI